MAQEITHSDFDEEVTQMLALATALTDTHTLPKFTFPTSPTLSLPGVAVVTSEEQGGQNADA